MAGSTVLNRFIRKWITNIWIRQFDTFLTKKKKIKKKKGGIEAIFISIDEILF